MQSEIQATESNIKVFIHSIHAFLELHPFLVSYNHLLIIPIAFIIGFAVNRWILSIRTFPISGFFALTGSATLLAFTKGFLQIDTPARAFIGITWLLLGWTFWFFLLAYLSDSKYGLCRKCYRFLTNGFGKDANAKMHFDSKLTILKYCNIKSSLLSQIDSSENNEEAFKRTFDMLGTILLSGFFQHDNNNRDYHMAFYKCIRKKMYYFHGISGTNYGQQPSRRPKNKESQIYRSFIEKRVIRFPQDVSKKDLKPPLKRKLESFICVPVLSDGKAIGVIVIDSVEKKDQFDKRQEMLIHLEMVQDFASFLSIVNSKIGLFEGR